MVNTLFYKKYQEKGGKSMAITNFLAYRIISGKLTFSSVPDKLKANVKEILIESGCEDLAV